MYVDDNLTFNILAKYNQFNEWLKVNSLQYMTFFKINFTY